MMNIFSTPPDGKCRLELVNRWEIRLGPAYYCCYFNERPVARKTFGRPYLWSPDFKFLVLQGWLNSTERLGLDTSLFICSVQESKYHSRTRAKGGFILPVRFEETILVFATEFYGREGERHELELDVAAIEEWRELPVGLKRCPLDFSERLMGGRKRGLPNILGSESASGRPYFLTLLSER